MKRKELVELLNREFGEDEEVYVLVEDEKGEWSDPIVGVREVTKTRWRGRYELEDAMGRRRRVTREEAAQADPRAVRIVSERVKETRKHLVVE